MNDEPVFLDRKIIDGLHEKSLLRYGGSAGLRDDGLIESAISAAMNTYLYTDGDLFDLAAAYAYHIAQAQAFLDGNKRTAVGAALSFLKLNGIQTRVDDGTLHAAMIDVADRKLDKSGLAGLLRNYYLI